MRVILTKYCYLANSLNKNKVTDNGCKLFNASVVAGYITQLGKKFPIIYLVGLLRLR